MKKMFARHKYNATRTLHAGMTMMSKLEASVYDMLVLMQKTGHVNKILQQTHVKMTLAEITYIPDFMVMLPDGSREWHEAKGFETPEWRLKKRLWEFYGPGPLHIWRGSYKAPRITETVIPKITRKLR